MTAISVEVSTSPDPLFDGTIKEIGDLTKPTKEAILLLQRTIVRYPPQPSGSTYKRTGKLGRSWKPELVGSGGVLGRVVSLGSIAPYNVYVQEASKQAPQNTHWKTAQDVAKQQQGAVVKIFEDWAEDTIGNV